jgi:hypothetical protein
MQYDTKSTTGPQTRLVENGGPDHTVTRGVLWTMAPAIWAMSDPRTIEGISPVVSSGRALHLGASGRGPETASPLFPMA